VPAAARLLRGLGLEQALLLDDATRHIGQAQVALARSKLKPAERILLRKTEPRHQQALGALDDLSILECLLRAIDLRPTMVMLPRRVMEFRMGQLTAIGATGAAIPERCTRCCSMRSSF